MPYKLRFVQKFKADKEKEFMALERQFAAMEREHDEFPEGRRYKSYAGRESTNTFIWEAEFDSLAAAQEALAFLDVDPRHEGLFQRQVPYFEEAYTEIYEVLDF